MHALGVDTVGRIDILIDEVNQLVLSVRGNFGQLCRDSS
jgi:hypothetical protein